MDDDDRDEEAMEVEDSDEEEVRDDTLPDLMPVLVPPPGFGQEYGFGVEDEDEVEIPDEMDEDIGEAVAEVAAEAVVEAVAEVIAEDVVMEEAIDEEEDEAEGEDEEEAEDEAENETETEEETENEDDEDDEEMNGPQFGDIRHRGEEEDNMEDINNDEEIEELLDQMVAAVVENARIAEDRAQAEARALEEFNRRQRQRNEILAKRLNRFQDSARFSKLHLTDCHWHHLLNVNQYPQKVPLCSYSYGYRQPVENSFHDLNDYDITKFSAESFLEITGCTLYSFGVMPVYNKEISIFIFERTMKIMIEYCNIMYDKAVERGRTHISSREIQELMWRNKILFKNYMTHYYPIVHPNDGRFGAYNEYTRRIHVSYHSSPEMRNVYHSKQLYLCNLVKALRFTQMIFDFNPNSCNPSHLPYYEKTFCYPFGNGISSCFAANRFHEALGMPPLETELISVLDFLARQVMAEIVYRTVIWMDEIRIPYLPTLQCYQVAMHMSANDILLGFDMEIVDSFFPPPIFFIYPKVTVDVSRYYIRSEMLRALENYREDFYERHYRFGAEGFYQSFRDQLMITCARKR